MVEGHRQNPEETKPSALGLDKILRLAGVNDPSISPTDPTVIDRALAEYYRIADELSPQRQG